jgi:hypothetical protein
MKKILAIGGAVIKTARDDLAKVIQQEKVEMLIHNGGSIFHDFQLAVDPPPHDMHSYPMEQLMDSQRNLSITNNRIRQWFYSFGENTPDKSITRLCNDLNIPVLMFTGLACDWWQFSIADWSRIAVQTKVFFNYLVDRFKRDRFHYICMGSAVIHPEVFIKAVALAKIHRERTWFTADVVDFKRMYRPETRVAQYGKYYRMTHERFLQEWVKRKEN